MFVIDTERSVHRKNDVAQVKYFIPSINMFVPILVRRLHILWTVSYF